MDAVQAANSGHPGMPMGMADIAEVLWNDFLKHNPNNPRWWDRDRFVLSNGHGSMLLYSVLHLTGYPLSMDDLRHFRQLGSHTAGHPERDIALGIETTTGPLGQGVTNAVGMAIAERQLAATFNRPGFDIVDHATYVFLGDGCLMEGISHEACSLAGTLGLGKLICIYDDNGISIDGDVKGWFTDDTAKRFEAYGWHVIDHVDGHDPAAIADAISTARSDESRPTLICCKTVIGFGAPNKQGSAATHGAPLGAEEVAAAREALDWPYAPFEVPDDVAELWDARQRGADLERTWQGLYDDYADTFPELASELARRMASELPDDWRDVADRAMRDALAAEATMATRKASLAALNALAPALPEMIGGSADLTGSNCTFHAQSSVLTSDDPGGNYINFGVREFAMTAIGNGLALHGGVLPYSGTFLVFSDYARNAVRMAALMNAGNVLVYTHDSIGLGEDGPTHQPVEHTASLRLVPNLFVWRPADTVETTAAWIDAIERRDAPTALILTRQNLDFLPRSDEQADAIRRGGYILRDTNGRPDVILIATGSEVAICTQAAEALATDGIAARVVSMPCCELFAMQDADWREHVLPARVTARVAVEAGAPDGWWRYVGDKGRIIGMRRFGESAPADELFRKYGFTAENVARQARELAG
jgi:transketolase